MWQYSFLKWAPCILHVNSWQIYAQCTWAVNELTDRIYWNILDFYELSEKSAFYELRASVTFILDPPPRAAARAVYELRTCRIYWNILDFYELSENSVFLCASEQADLCNFYSWSSPTCCTCVVLWALGEKCILWAPGFCNFYSWSSLTCCCTHGVNELYLQNLLKYTRFLWALGEKFILWAPNQAFVTFILDPPSRAAARVQFMSSEHADVYERGELDQDTGGDQDVDIR